MQTLHTYNMFLSSSYVGLSREKNVILERRLDFADILQRIKNEKKVKDLKIQVVLDSLRTVWRVFDTFHLPGQTKLISLNFGDNGWHLRREFYDKYKKTVIFVLFEATLLETK